MPPARTSGTLERSIPAPEDVYEGRILHQGRIIPAELGVADGRIVALRPSVSGGRRHPLGERILLPSATDVHVHFRDPSPPEEFEGFGAGTLQAVHGGVGAVVDMPNTQPPVDSLEHLEEKEDHTRHRLQCDVLLYALLGTRTPIESLAERVGGFKLYLAPTTGSPETPGWEELPGLLERVAATQLPLHVHAEDPGLFREPSQALDPPGWDAARPLESEIESLKRLLPGPPGLKLHIAHVTARATLEQARDAGVSAEATPHHLLLSAMAGADARWKTNPPLRSEPVRAGLYEAFCGGGVPMLASDHAPHPREAKERPFPLAPSGVPGVETSLPLLLAEVRASRLPLQTLLAAACRRPARFLGLPRGELAVGWEANFLAVDFRERRRVQGKELHGPFGWTPFEGFEAIFPDFHWLRGELLLDDGEAVGTASGRILRPGDLPEPPARRPLTGTLAEGPREAGAEAGEPLTPRRPPGPWPRES